MKYPMREKYVDELTGGPWFIFGRSTQEIGTVCISNSNTDILPDVPIELAAKIVELQNKFMQDLYKLIVKE